MAKLLFITMVLAIALATTVAHSSDLSYLNHGSLSSLRGSSRVLAQVNPSRVPATCDNFPRMCRNKESSGPDCCGKQCVNVDRDVLNCGRCGHRCRYGEACCGGSCVNVSYDRKNCGSCSNMCNKGASCQYGMCSYA